MPSLTIKEWSEDDRPREKLLNKGVAALSNAELLAIIIGSGSQDENAVELSKKLLAQANNSLAELGKATVADLKKHKGIGEAKAVGIVAAMELGRRRGNSGNTDKPQIKCSGDIFKVIYPVLGDLSHEEFWAIFLNRSNRVTGIQRLGAGGLSATVVDIRLLMKYAIDRLATAIIICHNHPSGNRQPGTEDMTVTAKIKEAGALLSIPLIDHLIIAGDHYYSFADEGLL
ncbi:MAG: DNA repair protein RadC [Bacteroidales bacterium]|jgi:DNA repair protein RadC|nr:DNA repair protein RadC [Bacteroidales bacterium]